MSSPHLTLEDIARFVDGAHPEDEAVRAHVRACAACAAALAKEAALDEELQALERDLVLCPGCDRASADGVVAGGASARCAWCGVAFAPGGMRVERVLAESDHGRLYLAEGEDGPVALKEIVFARVPDVAALDRFERETRMLRQLVHPRIPRYVASFNEGEGVHLRLYLAQRYVDGPSLLEELEKHRFDEGEARGLAAEVLAILADLQALSPPVLHRDVKPANLVRESDGKLALVDFGSARDVQHTAGATLVGTFGYMPVEQLSGIVDESTDVYALGATLVHLLSRRAPWEVLSPSSRAPLSSLALSPGFRRFLERMLAPRDEGRFANAREALAALTVADAGKAKGRKAAVGAGLAALVLLGAVGVPLALHHPTSKIALDPVVPEAPAPPPPPPAPPRPPHARDVDDGPPRGDKLRPADVLVVVKEHVAAIKSCGYKRFTGTAKAHWDIESGGATSHITTENVDDVVAGCMRAEIAKWRFPAFTGTPIPVSMPFKLDANDTGELLLRSSPWAKVTVDGADIGTTPLKRELAAGKHTLVLTGGEPGLRKTVAVDIRPGESTKLDVRLP